MTDIQTFDVVVIGGGSGLTAAYYAEQDGKSIALVDAKPDALGGTCINRGCIPTKGLIQSAEVLKTIRDAEHFGIHVDQSSVRVDFPAIVDGVQRRREKSAAGVKSWVDSAFTPFYGRAHFVSDKLLEMEDGRRLTGDKIFIATGARPGIPPIEGLDEVEYWTNETALVQREQPASLLILGGGYIGCELGHFFATLGTRVTIIDRSDCLLRDDDEVRALFTEEFGKKVELVRNASATRVVREGGRTGVVVEQVGETSPRTVWADALMVASGRTPNTDVLDLENTGVELDGRGYVSVDAYLRTSHPDIYAYGDVIGQAMFKHTSSREGEIAYRNSQGAEIEMSYWANPHAVFSDPQIGAVGMTERACREQGFDYTVAKRPYSGFAKGKIIGSPPGFAKLVVENGSDRILGFHMVGPNAADLVHEVAVAMSTERGTADQIRNAIHIHPTLAELVQQVFAESGQ